MPAITFDEIHARLAAPTPPAAIGATLTPRGDAAIALYRFVRQLRALSVEDRAYIVGMLRDELADDLAAGA